MDKKQVLVVDDEKDLTFLISEILESQGGYDVVIANDGKEAIDKLRSFEPDIVFLDFVMPALRGNEVLRFINENLDKKKTSVILMSGLGEMVYFKKKDAWKWLPNREIVKERGEVPELLKWKRSSEEIAQEFGVKAFLPKPFSRETFLEVLQSINESD